MLFGSFIRNGKRYNCAYEKDSYKKGKGFKVKYWSDRPNATNFYNCDSTCYTKNILPLQ